MKKLIAVFAVLLFVAPAFAADWAFYGSQRVNTFFVNNDYGKAATTDRFGVGSPGSGKEDDWGLQWDFQPGSRFGAKVKADKVSAQIEMGLNMSNSNSGAAGGSASASQQNGTIGGDGFVSARRAYGVWKFSDTGSLKIGKDYSPVSNLISGKVFDDDGGLLGNGDVYGGRPGQVALTLGGFEIAFMTNPLITTNITTAGTDADWNTPKIEARYTLKLDKFEIAPFAGFNYFKIDKGNSTTITDDLDIYSYLLGLNLKGDIGAFYFTAQGAWGQNWRNARWSGGFNPGTNANAAASVDGGDDVNDATSWSVGGTAGLKFTDTIKFEVGGGYRNDDSDVSGNDDIGGWITYGQVVLTLAPGVYLVPEIGYIDYMDNNQSEDLGYTWYAGMKWQIDF